jgi:hypothetical protein
MLHINVGSASNRYEESQSKKKIHPKLERQIRNVGFLKHKRTQKQIKDRETLRAIILFFSYIRKISKTAIIDNSIHKV